MSAPPLQPTFAFRPVLLPAASLFSFLLPFFCRKIAIEAKQATSNKQLQTSSTNRHRLSISDHSATTLILKQRWVKRAVAE